MTKIRPPSDEVLQYIKENYSYSDGQIDGPQGTSLGWSEKTHAIYYHKVQIKNKRIRRSHLVWYMCRGYWPVFEIDHKDKDSLNDKIENLREVTFREQQENKKNSRMYKGFSIVFCKDKPRNKPWRVRNQRLNINLGYFESEEMGKMVVEQYLEKYGKWWL